MSSWSKITQKNLDLDNLNKPNQIDIKINKNESDNNENVISNDMMFDNLYRYNVFNKVFEITNHLKYYFFENIGSSKISDFFIENIDVDKYVEAQKQIDEEDDEEMQTM